MMTLSFTTPVEAQTPKIDPGASPRSSLFFSDVEIEMIEKAILDETKTVTMTMTAAPVAVIAPPVKTVALVYGPPEVYLSAIVYFGPKSWNFWLNDNRITPESPMALVDVISVSHNAIEIALQVVSDRPPILVRLKPNQTYVARSREVIEGKAPDSNGWIVE